MVGVGFGFGVTETAEGRSRALPVTDDDRSGIVVRENQRADVDGPAILHRSAMLVFVRLDNFLAVGWNTDSPPLVLRKQPPWASTPFAHTPRGCLGLSHVTFRFTPFHSPRLRSLRAVTCHKRDVCSRVGGGGERSDCDKKERISESRGIQERDIQIGTRMRVRSMTQFMSEDFYYDSI